MLVAMPPRISSSTATRKNLPQPTVASQSPSRDARPLVRAATLLTTGADTRAASAAPALASAKTRRAVDSCGGCPFEGAGPCGPGVSVVMVVLK